MNNILVTGGLGFIGSRLVNRLMKENNITIVDNMSYGNFDNAIIDDDNILSHCKFVLGDCSNESLMNDLFSKSNFDYVYHIAGIAPLPDCQLNKFKCFDSNVKSTLVLLDCCQKYGIKRFMFASTNAIYENINKERFPLNETMDIETTLFYPTSKLMSEEICKSFSRTYNVPITCFRFANVYGAGMDVLRKYPPVTGAFIKALYNNIRPTIYNDGTQSRDFVYIEDLLDLILLPMNNNTNEFEIVNVGTNESHSVNEQFEIIRKYMNKNITPIYVSGNDFWKKLNKIYDGHFVISTEVLNKEVNKCSLMDYTYAMIKYGWSPKFSFEEGLHKTIDETIKILEKRS